MDCEVLIAGGGMVGLSLGHALAGAGVEVVVVDREEPAKAMAPAFDGRASAIARGPQQALAALGLWQSMAPHAQPIHEIRVSDGQVGRRASSLFLHYDQALVDGEPLGFLLENRHFRQGLDAALGSTAQLHLIAPTSVERLEASSSWTTAWLGDGQTVRARLAVAADGAKSRLRAAAGIKLTGWDYPQVGIVGTVVHEKPHLGVAHEHFLPAGPFAMLPLVDDYAEDDDGARVAIHRSSIVWTERRDLAPAMLRLGEADFTAEIARRFGDSLGALSVTGPRWSYPLSLSFAQRCVALRLALLGDAAHRIHPIAGQGLNLGLRDVAALAESIVEARRLGLDSGDASVLQRYERWRRLDNLVLIAATDALNRLFSNDIGPIRLARDLGLAAVDRLPSAKRFFMRHAMGLVGDLPRLLEGRPL